jgi:putative ABC transport system permease protein
MTHWGYDRAMPPRSWLRAFRLPWRTPARDVDAELRFHFDERVAELVASGMSAKEALDKARLEFGDEAAVREQLIGIDRRIANRHSRKDLMESIAQPFRHAFRRLVRQPVFFALTAGSLALALGVTTAAVGFADAWMNPPVPLSDPDKLVTIRMWGGPARSNGGLLVGERWEFIKETSSFAQVVFTTQRIGTMTLGEEVTKEAITIAAPHFTDLTGIRPRLGRTFIKGPADEGAVLVGDYFWRKHFANRDSIGDARVMVDGKSYDVIGVLPRSMVWPLNSSMIRVPVGAEVNDASWPMVRLKEDATIESVQAELAAAATRINAVHGVSGRPYGFTVSPLVNLRAGSFPLLHAMSLLTALFILVIACANVASLLLARAAARRRDLALRLSLGATRGALVADVLAELAIIAVTGLMLGLAAAQGAAGLIRSVVPAELTWSWFAELSWSWRVFAASGGALVFVLVAAGLLPALQVSRIPPIEPLKESSGAATGRQPQRMKSVVMFQLGVSLMMLVMTSLMSRATLKLDATDFGYDPRVVFSATGSFVYRWNESLLGGKSATEATLERVASTQGVSLASFYQSERPEGMQIISDDVAQQATPLMSEQYTIAGARFMETVGIPVIEGRDFAAGDSIADGAVILDDSAARILFPTTSPIGRRVKLGRATSTEPWRPVVGVVKSVRSRFFTNSARGKEPVVYVARSLPDRRRFAVVARAAGRDDVPMTQVRLRRDLAPIMPHSAYLTLKTLSADHEEQREMTGRMAQLFGILSMGALLFAVAGMFAVLSFAVSQRMREFGIRMAVGADRTQVARLVLKDALELALGGTAIGGALGLGFTLVVAIPVFGFDPITAVALIVAELVLIAACMTAALAPALRATRVNPVDVLRAS